MIRVAILGATGYTARELLELLLRHPEVEVTVLATRSEENLHVADVHPSLRSRLDLRLENLYSGKKLPSAPTVSLVACRMARARRSSANCSPREAE